MPTPPSERAWPVLLTNVTYVPFRKSEPVEPRHFGVRVGARVITAGPEGSGALVVTITDPRSKAEVSGGQVVLAETALEFEGADVANAGTLDGAVKLADGRLVLKHAGVASIPLKNLSPSADVVVRVAPTGAGRTEIARLHVERHGPPRPTGKD